MSLTASQITEEEILLTEKIADEMTTETDLDEWVKLNNQFHELMIEPCHSPIITQIIGILRNVSTLYIVISLKVDSSRIPESNEEHHKLIQACREKNSDKAAALVQKHMLHTLELAEKGLMNINPSGEEVISSFKK
jgi:DNA-binding GntR family transcriptional regulator